MTDKVKLPKEVAEELTAIQQHESYPIRFVIDLFHGEIAGEEGALKRYFDSDRSRRIEVIMKAIFNGYEVEQSPEDKVREYYKDLVENGRELDPYRNQLTGLVRTLNLLNIKIEGVNA